MALIASGAAGSIDLGVTAQLGPIDCTGATSLAVLVVYQTAAFTGTLSDGVNTYTPDVIESAAGTTAVLFVCGSPDVSSPLTWTYTCASTPDFASLYLQAHSGASVQLDDDSNFSFSATSLAANSAVTPVAGGVVLAGLGYNQADTLAIGGSFSIADQLPTTNGTVDFFTGSAGVLSGNWSTTSGAEGASRTGSGTVRCNPTGSALTWSEWADVFDDDQYAQMTVVDVYATQTFGLVMRAQPGALSGYACWVEGGTYRIDKYTAGSGVLIHDTGVAAVNGDIFKCEVTGSGTTTIKVYVDSGSGFTLIDTQVDASSPWTSGTIAIGGYGPGVSNVLVLDNFLGNNVSGPPLCGTYFGGGFAYYYAPNTSTVNPTWSWSTTADVEVVLESLQIPATGGNPWFFYRQAGS